MMLVRDSATVSLAIAAGSSRPLMGCSPQAVAIPVVARWLDATTPQSARGVWRGPTHCCWATSPVTERSTLIKPSNWKDAKAASRLELVYYTLVHRVLSVSVLPRPCVSKFEVIRATAVVVVRLVVSGARSTFFHLLVATSRDVFDACHLGEPNNQSHTYLGLEYRSTTAAGFHWARWFYSIHILYSPTGYGRSNSLVRNLPTHAAKRPSWVDMSYRLPKDACMHRSPCACVWIDRHVCVRDRPWYACMKLKRIKTIIPQRLPTANKNWSGTF